MLAILLMLVLAVNGGLFAGTILYTAMQSAKVDQILSFTDKIWPLFPFS